MPRIARKQSETDIYHVMLRGNNCHTIFFDEEDCQKYLQCLEECKKVSEFKIYAYCLMGNHLHLLIKVEKEPLELIFKRIGVRYVAWYNWKYKRSGHLFQGRFKSEPVESDEYFLTVLKYIYQNPVKAGICRHPAKYPWSSFSNFGNCSFVDDEEILNFLTLEELEQWVLEYSSDKCLEIEDFKLTDIETVDKLKEIGRIQNPEEFQFLNYDEKRAVLITLQDHRCSIRQLARVTGLSKGIVERMLS